MSIRSSILTVSIAFGLSATAYSTPTFAQGTCAPFTLVSTGEGRSVEYVDLGGAGGSSADKRIGVRALVAEDGSPAGQARWLLTVLEPHSEDSGASYVEWMFSLPDGDIFAKGLRVITNAPDDTSKQTADATAEFAIVGGTGAYSGARGTHTKTSEGLKETYSIDISCD